MSPLVVKDNSTFRDAVLKGLEEICPCFELSIDAGGQVHAAAAITSCSCYLAHKASCNLIRGLIDHADTTWIEETATGGGNTYSPNKDTAYWNTVKPTPDGLNIPSIGLAHELIHAWRDRTGKIILNSNQQEECNTIWGENQVRAEMGQPDRQDYDTYYCFEQVLDVSGDPPLDDADLEGCAIDPGILEKAITAVARVMRAILDAIRVLLSRWWKIFGGGGRPVVTPQVPSAPDAPDETDFEQDAADFAAMVLAGPADLFSQFTAALHTRFDSPQRAHIASLTPGEDEESPPWILVEGVDLDGWYRVIFIQLRPGTVVLVTNLRLSGDPELFVGPPGALVEYHIQNQTGVEAADALLTRMVFADGVAGDPQVFDGIVQFLKLGTTGILRKTALYAYEYPGFIRDPVPPSGAEDLARWTAVVGTYELWRDLMATDPTPFQEIAPA